MSAVADAIRALGALSPWGLAILAISAWLVSAALFFLALVLRGRSDGGPERCYWRGYFAGRRDEREEAGRGL